MAASGNERTAGRWIKPAITNGGAFAKNRGVFFHPLSSAPRLSFSFTHSETLSANSGGCAVFGGSWMKNMIERRKIMKKKKAARKSCNLNRAKAHNQGANQILAYERDAYRAGVVLMITFGVMFVVGAWMGWC